MTVSFIIWSSYLEDIFILLDRNKWHTSNLCHRFGTGSKKCDCAALLVAFTAEAVLFQLKQLLACRVLQLSGLLQLLMEQDNAG